MQAATELSPGIGRPQSSTSWRLAAALALPLLLAGCGGSGGSGGLLQGTAEPSVEEPQTAAENQATQNIANTPDSMRVVSVNPQQVQVTGAGTNQTSIITFEVLDFAGRAVETDTCVSFTLENGGLGGGEALNPGIAPVGGDCSGQQTISGQAGTVFRSGQIAGTVNIVGFLDTNPANGMLDPGEIQATATLSVSGGPPSGLNYGVAADALNFAGLETFGVTSDITVFLADRFTNPVPNGTAVTFRTFDQANFQPSIEIDGTGVTAGGASSVTVQARSQAPVPSQGLVEAIALTQSGISAQVRTLLRDPASNLIYAGTDGGGIFRTTNAGQTWRQVGRAETGLFSGFVRDLAFENPANPVNVYAATNRGLFHSIGGSVWEPRDGRAGARGVVLTEDAGYAGGVRIKYDFPATVLPSSRARLRILVDGTPQSASSYTLMVPGGSSGDNFVRGTSVQFHTPRAAGVVVQAEYDTLGQLPFNVPLTGIEVDSTNSNNLAVSSLGEGVFISTNAGVSWQKLPQGLTNTRIQSLAYDSTTLRLYAATRGAGVFTLDNPFGGGTVWTQQLTGLLDGDVTSVAVDPGGTGRVVIGTRTEGVQIAAFPAITWSTPTNNIFRQTGDVHVSSVRMRTATQIFVTTVDNEDPSITRGGVYVSDAALNFAQVANGSGLQTRFLFDTAFDNTGTDLHVAARGRAVFRSQASAAFTEVSGTAPDNLGNEIYEGVTTAVTGTQFLNAFVTPFGGTTACTPTGDGTCARFVIANGDQRTIIVNLADTNGRPPVGGTTYEVTYVETLPDGCTSGSAAAGTLNETIDDTIVSGPNTTDFLLQVGNNSTCPSAYPGDLEIKVNAPGGGTVASATFTFTIQP